MKLLIGIPCKSQMPTRTTQSLLGLKLPMDTEWAFVQDGMIYEARNKIALHAINNGFSHVMWLDSDMVYEPHTILSLYEDNKDIITGMFYRRKPPFIPAHMSHLTENEFAELTLWPKDELFKIEGMGTGIALTKVSALSKIYQEEGELFLPMKGLSEDYAFSLRARRYFDIWCDPKVEAGHITEMVVDKRWYNPENG